MAENYVVKDSGERLVFETGAQRDVQTDKGDFSLLPYEPLRRLAVLYEKGAAKYDRNNWQKGIPLSRYLSSMRRHALQAGNHQFDGEDHLAAVMFNACGFAWTEAEIKAGRLPLSLDDIDWIEDKDLDDAVVELAHPAAITNRCIQDGEWDDNPRSDK